MQAHPRHILALDIGDKRIGVAIGSLDARLPRPLTTLPNDEQLVSNLKQLIAEQGVVALVAGRPRDMRGNPTSQTEHAEKLAADLKARLGLPVYLQDEAVTSVRAREELEERGKPYNKGEVDALAATYILEDFFGEKEDERDYGEL